MPVTRRHIRPWCSAPYCIGWDCLWKYVKSLPPTLGFHWLYARLLTVFSSFHFHFPGLLGVPDATVYRYNAALRFLVSSLALTHISFVRVRDLLSEDFDPVTYSRHDMTEEEYVESASPTRETFLATNIGAYDVNEHIKNDEGALRTYRGYLRFLKLDLNCSHLNYDDKECGVKSSRRKQEKAISVIAKAMMGNGSVSHFVSCLHEHLADKEAIQRFSALVARAFPDAIRLSIHPHQNAGPKFALKIFPNVELACTPVCSPLSYISIDTCVQLPPFSGTMLPSRTLMVPSPLPTDIQSISPNTLSSTGMVARIISVR